MISREVYKSHIMRKIFNFWKELKKIRRFGQKATQIQEGTLIGFGKVVGCGVMLIYNYKVKNNVCAERLQAPDQHIRYFLVHYLYAIIN